MPTTATRSRCGPELHGGVENTPEADFLVSEATSPDEGRTFKRVSLGRSFACCAEHLDHAIKYVLGNGAKLALIRVERSNG